MIQKGAAALAVLTLVALTSFAGGQTNAPVRPSTTPIPAQRPISPAQQQGGSSAGQPAPTGAAPGALGTSGRSDCFGGNCDLPQPRITISTPAPTPAPWPWQERISWAANLILVVVGYAGIMMALALLRKIEKQGKYVEEAVQTAAESARATLKLMEMKERAERPWILMNVRPANTTENGFTVTATNRGRGPARILSTVDDIVIAADEKNLAAEPVFKKEAAAPQEPTVLLPDETVELISFSRDEVKEVCETEERLKRVEDWEEKIYIYGKVAYQDLAAPDDAPAHESSWLCWYIHGRQKSGMVMAGPPSYNRHS